MQQHPGPYKTPDDDSFNIKTLLLKYSRHWKLFLITTIVTLAGAFIYNQYTPAVYKVESKFLIKEEGNAINLFDVEALSAKDFLPKGQKMANDIIMLKSRTCAEQVLNRLPFDVEYYQDGFFAPRERFGKTPIRAEVDWTHSQITDGLISISWNDDRTYSLDFNAKSYLEHQPDGTKSATDAPLSISSLKFGEWTKLPYLKIRVFYTGMQNSGSTLIKLRDRESLVTQYTGEALQILPADKTSSIATITLETRHTEKGRVYLNTLMDVFLENELNDKNTIARNTIQFIDTQITGVSDSLNLAEQNLERFRSSHRTYDISSEGNTIFEKLSEMEKSLAEAKYRRKYYQNLSDYLTTEDYSKIMAPSGLGIDDNVLNKLIEDLILLQSDKSKLTATQTANSPAVKEVQRKITDHTNSIKEVLKNVDRNTEILIQDLEGRISKIEHQFGSLPQTEQELLNIRRKYSLNETIYTFLLQRRAEAAIALASNTASNKIIDAAVTNVNPMQLRPLLNYILALFIGLALPVAFLFLKETFSTKITDIAEVEAQIQIPLLGLIAKNKELTQLAIVKETRTSLAESFRALRTNINFLVTRTKQLTILVTSSIAGEGKTFCAANLATVYAMSNKRTLLVGCDLRKVFTFEEEHITNTEGISTYLSGQTTDLKAIIQKTNKPGFDILTPGPVPPNPAELLVSDRFEKMLDQLKKEYDVILLDSSPVGITNETLHLTKLTDFTLFILRYNYSSKEFIDEVNGLKTKKNLANVYAVINDVDKKHLKHNGYGYGYYSEDSEHKKRSPLSMFNNKAAM